MTRLIKDKLPIVLIERLTKNMGNGSGRAETIAVIVTLINRLNRIGLD